MSGYLLQKHTVPADSEAAAAAGGGLLGAATCWPPAGERSFPSVRGRFARIKSILFASFLYLSVGCPGLINVCVPSASLGPLAPAAALTGFHGELQLWLCQLETLTVP